MILFIAKTWFLWWMLAIVLLLRWLHVLSAGRKPENLDTLAAEEENHYIVAWRILHKAHVISWFERQRAH